MYHSKCLILNVKAMKNKILLSIGLLAFFCSGLSTRGAVAGGDGPHKENITVVSTSGLLNLSQTLTSEYGRSFPGAELAVRQPEESEINDMLQNNLSIGIISQGTSVDAAFWKILIGRDVVVPIINSENPFLKTIGLQGVSAENLAKVFTDPNKKDWGTLLQNERTDPVHLYMLKDGSVTFAVTDFLQVNLKHMDVQELATPDELIAQIGSDPNAIGFCRLANILGADGNIASHIGLLPIDKNGNGRLDYHEQIYGNADNLNRGIWIGKYPRSLIRNIYAISSVAPGNKNVTAFLSWVLTDGQKFMEPNGISRLVFNERQTKLEALNSPVISSEPLYNHYAAQRTVLLIVGIIVVIGLLISIISYRSQSRKMKPETIPAGLSGVIDENSVSVPEGLYFDKTHTWAFMEKDGSVRVGVDDFLQHITGRYTRIKMKDPGANVKKNEPVLSLVQQGKQINVYAPLSGKIKEINEMLVTNPSLINTSPYSEGWIYLIEPSNWLREIRFFKMSGVYREWLKNEFLRLKDFLATVINPGYSTDADIALQEGGGLRDRVLQDLAPEIWEDFQKHFIDNSQL